MKKRCIVSIVLLILTIKFSTAQKYQPGYIITNQLDTVLGLLNNRSYVENADGCEFKKSNEDKVVYYKPFEINSYRFTDGKYYISKEVTIDSIAQKVFLEYLVKGKANIYYLRNPQGEYYFIQKENESMIPLTAEKYYMNYDESNNKWITTKNENSSNIGESKKYIGTIKYVLRDAPGLYDEIDKSQLDHSDLIKLAVDYHKFICNDESCIIYEKKVKSSISLALTGTVGVIKYSSANAGETNFSNIKLQLYGITLIDQMPLLNERISFRPSILFGTSNFKVTDMKSADEKVISYLSAFNFDIPLLFQYYIVKHKRFKVYYSLGPHIEYTNIHLDSAYYYRDIRRFSTTASSNDYYISQFKGIYIGASTSAGMILSIAERASFDIGVNYSYTAKFGTSYRQLIGLNFSLIYELTHK